jgi:hypothetical protein
MLQLVDISVGIRGLWELHGLPVGPAPAFASGDQLSILILDMAPSSVVVR